jgi:hypothetical protein
MKECTFMCLGYMIFTCIPLVAVRYVHDHRSWVPDDVHPPVASGAQRLPRMKRRSGKEFPTVNQLYFAHVVIDRDIRSSRD